MLDNETNNQYIGVFACALAMAKAAEHLLLP